MSTIDLNADLGEGYASDEELMAVVTSCNIACGGHAGDPTTMAKTVQLAIDNDVAVGAHPGYPDRDGFGRESGFLAGDLLYESLTSQVTALLDIAAKLGVKVSHVKPHGALYNDAVASIDLAEIIARVTAEVPGSPALMGMANSAMQAVASRFGVRFIAEGFVDRAYEADGTLVSRKAPGAVHSNAFVVSTQATRIAQDGEVTARDGSVIPVQASTLCIHGDSPGAAQSAQAVKDVLQANGIEVRAHAPR